MAHIKANGRVCLCCLDRQVQMCIKPRQSGARRADTIVEEETCIYAYFQSYASSFFSTKGTEATSIPAQEGLWGKVI